MKKLILCFVFMAITASAYAQYKVADSGEIIVEEIIENTGLSTQQAHDVIQAYLASAFNDSNRTIRLDTGNHLIYKGTFTHKMRGGFWTYIVDFEIDIAIKDNRMRIICSADTASGRSTQGGIVSYRLCEAAPIAEKHNITKSGLFKDGAIKLFNYTIDDLHAVIIGIKDSLAKGATSNDW